MWYLRLVHIRLDIIKRLVKKGPLKFLQVGSLPILESCLERKMTKKSFSAKGTRPLNALKLYKVLNMSHWIYKQEEVMNTS